MLHTPFSPSGPFPPASLPSAPPSAPSPCPSPSFSFPLLPALSPVKRPTSLPWPSQPSLNDHYHPFYLDASLLHCLRVNLPPCLSHTLSVCHHVTHISDAEPSAVPRAFDTPTPIPPATRPFFTTSFPLGRLAMVAVCWEGAEGKSGTLWAVSHVPQPPDEEALHAPHCAPGPGRPR